MTQASTTDAKLSGSQKLGLQPRPITRPVSALTAELHSTSEPQISVNAANLLVAPKATRSTVAGILGSGPDTAGRNIAVGTTPGNKDDATSPLPSQYPNAQTTIASQHTPQQQRLKRLGFGAPAASPTLPSPARHSSASPSLPSLNPISSSYVNRGSYTAGGVLQSSSLQSSSSGFALSSLSKRRPSIYRSYRQPRVGEPALVVFSGGSGFNSAAEEMNKKLTTRVTHVLPVSDDGGSTAEIVRVLGGPAVGDIRSRCLRLSDDSTEEGQAVKALLGHRLYPSNATLAKQEWAEVVEGTHELWKGIGIPYRDTIRAFLLHFNYEILREPSTLFNFCNGSIAGARTFLKSMDAAIFLYGRVSHIPPQSLVVPAVATSDRLTLGAELIDGTIIRGQNAISHPPDLASIEAAAANMSPVSYASSQHQAKLVVNKDSQVMLSSKIKRVFYLSPDVAVTTSIDTTSIPYEIYPTAHNAIPGNIYEADGIIYAMGSFFTSICPSLVLKGVGEAVARRKCRKILILNGGVDRETFGMDKASDYVRCITDHLNRAFSLDAAARIDNPPSSYVNCLFALRGSEAILIDEVELRKLGVRRIVRVDSLGGPVSSKPLTFAKEQTQVQTFFNGTEGAAGAKSLPNTSEACSSLNSDPTAAKPSLLYDTSDLVRALRKLLTPQRKSSSEHRAENDTSNEQQMLFEDDEDDWVSDDDELE